MLIMACILVFLSVALLLGAFGARVALAPRRLALDRLADMRPTTYSETLSASTLVKTDPKRWWEKLLPTDRKADNPASGVIGLTPDSATSRLLLHAGYRSRSALRGFTLSRLVCALMLGSVPLILGTMKAIPAETAFLFMATLTLVGYMFPKTYVRLSARRRQHRLRLSLPDALDLLVVCVEAGMGLNQAIVRVSEELRGTHPEIADEFRLVNLEIRAGRTRPEALRSLGERTGVDDIMSLASMIVQTDKFGTSIAKSLRVHSDSLRVERRQRAEEAAAKTTIKLIFPLLFCIFPSLFVVILGPAAMHLWQIFGGSPK